MTMKHKLRFYKENERWYADVPGVSKEGNEMVFGSDIFLEKISNGKPQVIVEFSNSGQLHPPKGGCLSKG